ncbi:MAG TPA: hypothetical protein PLY77_11610, partial [Plasticicumulans sp.]|nr:hypothetical protein [Plasticicumulans sp.]
APVQQPEGFRIETGRNARKQIAAVRLFHVPRPLIHSPALHVARMHRFRAPDTLAAAFLPTSAATLREPAPC